MTGKVILTGGNKCPLCGKVFTAIPPLRPNIEDRSFYGGRVKFFKEVECDCLAKYDLCIERKYNHLTCEEELNVINMIVLKEGKSKEEAEREKEEARILEAEQKTTEALAQAIEEKGGLPTLKQRKEIKTQTVLATIVDADTKLETLCVYTHKEIETMLKRRKIKFNKRDNKRHLAEILLVNDPSVVVASPSD